MTEGRFLADSSLHGIARRLRALGYDVAVDDAARLERLCAVARAEGRIVLTLSRRVPVPCAGVARCVVNRGDAAGTLRGIVARYAPAGRPFTRCTRCNAVLRPAPEDSDWAGAPVPPPAGVRVTGQCPGCRRCYWHGSHVDRVREWCARELGLALPAPGG